MEVGACQRPIFAPFVGPFVRHSALRWHRLAGDDMTSPACDDLPRTDAVCGAGRAEEHNPFYSFPGVCIESTRSWGPVSVDTVSRPAGTVVWQSDRHRIVYALTDIAGTIRNDSGPRELSSTA